MKNIKSYLFKKFNNSKKYVKQYFLQKLLNSKTYRFVYKTHNSIKTDILKPNSIRKITQAVLVLGIILWLTKSVPLTGAITIVTYSFSFLFVKALWRLIQNHVENTGTKSKFSFSGKFLRKDGNGDAFYLATENLPVERFEFFDVSQADEAGRLNMAAYLGGVWGTTLEDKIARNKNHIARNGFCFMAIKDIENPNKYIGYSHVFPVSQRVWAQYCNGEIADNKFKASDIIPTIPTKDDHRPFGLIRFSLAIVDESEFKLENNPNEKLGELLEKAAVFHMKMLIDRYFSNFEKIPALLQNMDKNYFDFFKSYSKMNKISDDGAVIIDFEVWNSSL